MKKRGGKGETTISLVGFPGRMQERLGKESSKEFRGICGFGHFEAVEPMAIRGAFLNLLDLSKNDAPGKLYEAIQTAVIDSPESVDMLADQVVEHLADHNGDESERFIAGNYLCRVLHNLLEGESIDEGASYQVFRLERLSEALGKECLFVLMMQDALPDDLKKRVQRLHDSGIERLGKGVFNFMPSTRHQNMLIQEANGDPENALGKVLEEWHKKDGKVFRTDSEFDTLMAEVTERVNAAVAEAQELSEKLRPFLTALGLPEGAPIALTMKRRPDLSSVTRTEIGIVANPRDPAEFVIKGSNPDSRGLDIGELLRQAMAGQGTVIEL